MLFSWCRRSTNRTGTVARRRARRGPALEVLEGRDLPSNLAPTYVRLQVAGPAQPLSGPPSPAGYGYTPAQVRHAYGFDQIALPGGANPDGTGTTIAIVDAYDDPKILSSTDANFASSDLHNFDLAFGLPDPVITKMNQHGGSTPPAADPGWSQEIALDVEWAHAIAPAAHIDLVEANDSSFTNLLAAVDTAASQPGVVAVSMSWGGNEFSGENSYDGHFAHTGVTFVASSGDSGAPPGWPAASPSVLAVGGTTLHLGSSNTISSESGWSGSGGGISGVESQPAYQNVAAAPFTTTARANPDVSYDADPNTGFPVYETVNNPSSSPWNEFGGTSDAAPQWAALVAIADQGRALAGKASLSGATQTLPMLYALPATDFHDVTSGNNGYPAGPGYDLVTGLGTPVANKLVPDLVGSAPAPTTTATHFSVAAPAAATAGSAFSVTVTALDASNNPVTNYTGRVHFTSSDPAAGLPADYTFTTADAGAHTFSVTLKTAGNDTVAVGDTFKTSLTGSATVSVTAAAASKFAVSGFPSSLSAGASGNFTVKATDAYGNPNPTYGGTVHFTSSDPLAVLPADTTLSGGTGTFSATLKTAGSQSLTATDKANGSVTGTQSGITVNPAAAASLVFGQQPTSTAAGAVITPAVTVKLLDAYGNPATAAVTLTLGGGTAGATLNGTNPVTAQGGVATFGNLSVNQTGTGYTLTASAAGLTATSGSFNVTTATSTTLEDFESANALGRYYYVGYVLPSVALSSAAAHDGAQGLVMQNSSDWIFRNDAAATVRRGDTISAWVQLANTADGRAYFGFGASAAGTLSAVLAPNTGQLLIQNNAGWGFTNLAAVNQGYQANHWYRVQVSWGSTGSITVQLYDSNGTTLLNTVSGTSSAFTSGGIAFRGIGNNKYFDTVTVVHGSGTSPLSVTVPPGGPVAVPPEDNVVVFVTVTPAVTAPAPAPTPAPAPAVTAPPVALDRAALEAALAGAQFAPAATGSLLTAPTAPALPAAAPLPAAVAPGAAPTARSGGDALSGGGDSTAPGDGQGDDELEPWLLDWLFSPEAANAAPAAMPPAAARQPEAVRGDGNETAAAAGSVLPASGAGLAGTAPSAAAVLESTAGSVSANGAWLIVLAGIWAQRPDRRADRRRRPLR